MVPNARKAPTQAGLITRSAYSAEPSRRAAPERRTARQGRPSGRAPGTAIGGCRACAAVDRAPRTRKGAFRRPPKRGEARRGTSRGLSRRMRARGARAAESALREPATPLPSRSLALQYSAKAGFNCRVRDGTGDPRLCRRRGAPPRLRVFELARNPRIGRPWRAWRAREKIAHRARCFNRGCEELGLLVPLG